MDSNTENPNRAAGMGRITLKERERNFRGQEFDQYFFTKKFGQMQVVKEATTYLEILNYTVFNPNHVSVQKDAKNEKTFSPDHISLPKESYKTMMDQFRLPLQALETSTVVGPFFWWAHHEDSDGKHLRNLPSCFAYPFVSSAG
ncbi:hypothetical protein PG993_014968 [Apiospora rasikravindrae]|uniref:Uncharacterized protein n=1 Tax=Apiospora rasikravindrae TaxID=990691 RepID=A0ABR1RPA2_9PEZI